MIVCKQTVVLRVIKVSVVVVWAEGGEEVMSMVEFHR